MVWASRADRETRERWDKKVVLVTGGAGFIGSNFVLSRIAAGDRVINLDKLTYAGNPANLQSVEKNDKYVFVKGGIEDREVVSGLLDRYKPGAVVHFAAESHVDRSILGPEAFIMTNVVGTFQLLDTVRQYWNALVGKARDEFRFVHVSTDEVYGSLSREDPAFQETTAYQPNSPYSASKIHDLRRTHRMRPARHRAIISFALGSTPTNSRP